MAALFVWIQFVDYSTGQILWRLSSAMELKIGLLFGLIVVLVTSPSFVISEDEIASESENLEEQPQNDMP